MHVIMAAFGSNGDVFPHIGFGKALREAGHSVSLITTGNFEAYTREAGLDYIELFSTAEYSALLDFVVDDDFVKKAFRFFNPTRRLADAEQVQLEVLLNAPERLYRCIETNYRPGESVLAITDVFTNGVGDLASRALGVPFAAVFHVPGWFRFFTPLVPPVLRGCEYFVKDRGLNGLESFWIIRELMRRYAALRASLQVPPMRHPSQSLFYGERLSIGLFPSWYVPWFDGQRSNAVLSAFPRYNPSPKVTLPPAIVDYLARGEAPVLFTNASWKSDPHAYFAASVQACRDLGLRAIMLNPIAQTFAGNDDAIITADRDLFPALLPHARAVVHHAGIGTSADVLAAGLPQLVVPSVVDQPHNAGTLTKLGVAISVPANRYARGAKAGLRTLLASEEIREACRQIAAHFEGGPDFSEAIAALEQLHHDAAGAPSP